MDCFCINYIRNVEECVGVCVCVCVAERWVSVHKLALVHFGWIVRTRERWRCSLPNDMHSRNETARMAVAIKWLRIFRLRSSPSRLMYLNRSMYAVGVHNVNQRNMVGVWSPQTTIQSIMRTMGMPSNRTKPPSLHCRLSVIILTESLFRIFG